MRRICVTLIAMMLAGCASTVPMMVSAPAPSPPADVSAAKTYAGLLRAEYQTKYNNGAKLQNGIYSDPLIGAAAGAATVALAAPTNSAKIIGYIGIGAASYQAGRDAYSPKGTLGLYAKGVAAVDCVTLESALFEDNMDDAGNLAALIEARGDLSDLISRASAAEATHLELKLSGGQVATQAQIDATTEQRKAMLAALAVARKLDEQAGEEIAAASVAGRMMYATLSAIEIKVLTKGQEGRSPSYEALVGSFTAAGQPAPAGAGNAAGGKGLDLQKQNFTDLASQLIGATSEVTRLLRPYAATVKSMRACPTVLD
jgi:hypothetical protein